MWVNKYFQSNGIDLSLEVGNINSSKINFEEFVNNVISKQNDSYSIEVGSPLNKEIWMTNGKEWEKPNSDKAGHQMNFEGFDKEGNILVCSWGKTYTIPKEFYERLEFISLKINTQNKNVEKGGKSK